ncbi:MAG: 2-C-methyl-D-erythritol 4-phosphate cytidylyltransferase [Bacilli bacterium]|nr:2-C-methyl-D-erythritol 4-phosphate cytidylyltransferase [Bacilli bacterium]
MKNKASAIILMAGNSTRYGNKNKNLETLNNQPVILYSINEFIKNKDIDEIIIVTKKEDINKLSKILPEGKNIRITTGGKERRDSVYNGLKIAKNDIVIIHDGARPNIKQSYINNCLKEMDNYDGCTVGVKAKDTIKIVNKKNEVVETTERINTYQIQTPQVFKKDILLKLHETNRKDNITDDCMLLEQAGYPVKVIDGDYSNLKITTKEDLSILEILMK